MSNQIKTEVIKNRYEFVYFFEVLDGNPNGDPDLGNAPRTDPETGHGLVTDVCLKRKIRNYVDYSKTSEAPFDIFVKEGTILNDKINESHDQKKNPYLEKKYLEDHKISKDRARQLWLSERYYDIRTFGGVLNTGKKVPCLTGPVQLAFARSIDPVNYTEHSLTVVVGRENPEQKGLGPRKYTIPYALYRTEGFISAKLAEKTGFGEDDLELLLEALVNMFDHDHSAARGKMCARKLIVFKHESALGNAPAHKLFDLVKVDPIGDEGKPPRSFEDYKQRISINRDEVPEKVELIEKL